MNDRTKAALIGGAVAGVLSIIPLVQYCCVLWAIGGGVLAVFMYMRGAGGTMTPGDGAKLGLRAGIVAAIIFLLIALPMLLLMGGAAFTDAMRQAGGSEAIGAGVGMAAAFIFMIIAAAILAGFTTVGGLIGAAIFGKGAGTAPPPPPPPAGGGFGGGYGDQPGGGGYGNPPAGSGGYGGPTGGSYGQGT